MLKDVIFLIFSSLEFLLYFLPIFMLVYVITPNRFKNVILVIGSLYFYGYGDLNYLPLLIISTGINFMVGLHLQKGRKESKFKYIKRTKILILAIALNVGMLMLFKIQHNELGFPLGISFYTFQILSYLIDVYRGEIYCSKSFIEWASYVTMFPKLISGPMIGFGDYEKQKRKLNITAENVQEGLKLLTVGLGIKVLLADRIGLLWREVQVTGFESITTPLAWIAAIAFSLKIYFDFHGYSLMARGVARMLGFELPANFSHPYMARSVREFYRRWHMTLGKWFTKYIYIPMGGSRKGEMKTVINLFVVWFVTSIWHGSSGNFLAWGMILFLLIVIERKIQKIPFLKRLHVIPRLYLWIVIPITWMCFAITDFSQLQIYLGRMFAIIPGIYVNTLDWQKALNNYGGLFVVSFVACTPLLEKIYHKMKKHIVGELILGGLFWFCIWRIYQEGNNTFMYFQF